MLTSLILLASLAIAQVNLDPDGKAIPQFKCIEIPLEAGQKISLCTAQVEGDISNSAEPSLIRPFHFKETLELDRPLQFTILAPVCHGTITLHKYPGKNMLILVLDHSPCYCGFYIDFIGELKYTVIFGKQTKSVSGSLKLSQRDFVEATLDDCFSYLSAYDKTTKILLMNTDSWRPDSIVSVSKTHYIIGGHRYKIQFDYAVTDSSSKNTKYDVIVRIFDRPYVYNSNTMFTKVELPHSRHWKKFETVIRTPLLSYEIYVRLGITLDNYEKDFGEMLVRNFRIVPLDNFQEKGP